MKSENTPEHYRRKHYYRKKELDELITKIIGIAEFKIIYFSENDLKKWYIEAKKISPDPDDVAYFALALYLGCPIWSNDKRLKEQNKVRIITTKELAQI
ncbi:MAG: PIN domain-containing protein [Nanoarchaeota archaeon]